MTDSHNALALCGPSSQVDEERVFTACAVFLFFCLEHDRISQGWVLLIEKLAQLQGGAALCPKILALFCCFKP